MTAATPPLPYSDYFATVIKACGFLWNGNADETLLFVTSGHFKKNQLLECHPTNPHVYRHIFFHEKLHVMLFDFQTNYQIAEEDGHDIYLKKISEPVLEYFKNEHGLSFDQNNIPHLRY